ncbi:MAG TPA: recombination-associated protein RdgC [Geobacteraceae bacterium]
MGILANTVSICQFRVLGDLPAGDLFAWAAEHLRTHAFRPIDTIPVELALGWVHVDDPQQSEFSVPAHFWRDHYLVFTLRRDERRLPSALLKAYQQVAEHEYLGANPGLSRVPKQKREELREAVRASLLAKTLPVPTTFDAVWDSRTGIVTFASVSPKNVEQFETLFKKTFPGLRLAAIHPYSRAESVLDETLQPALTKANQATSEAALDLIKANQWLGWDLFLWLMYRTMHDASSFRINQAGHAAAGEAFTAYLNDRLVLMSVGENGVQKITVAGPQDHFSEVHNALQHNKRITEAIIYLEKDEQTWRLTLKGELFHFASFKAPSVQIEKDATTDQASEREAVFYERMYLLEQGLQLFDSLFAAFLAERLGEGWRATEEKIRAWLAGA